MDGWPSVSPTSPRCIVTNCHGCARTVPSIRSAAASCCTTSTHLPMPRRGRRCPPGPVSAPRRATGCNRNSPPVCNAVRGDHRVPRRRRLRATAPRRVDAWRASTSRVVMAVCSSPTIASTRRGRSTRGSTPNTSRSRRSATAAKALRDRQRNWALYAPDHRGRAALIAERLPHVSAKPLLFGARAPTAPLGSWTLLAPDLLLASTRCSSPFPNGEPRFVEDRDGPPSRAYLKLWEALVRLDRWPTAGDVCLDLGASPGGWTWLLAQSGARVIAVDKAPLDPRVSGLANVEWRSDERVRTRTVVVRPSRLAVQRRDRLSGAPARAGRTMATIRARAQHGGHGEVPRARPTTGSPAPSRNYPAADSSICTTTGTNLRSRSSKLNDRHRLPTASTPL